MATRKVHPLFLVPVALLIGCRSNGPAKAEGTSAMSAAEKEQAATDAAVRLVDPERAKGTSPSPDTPVASPPSGDGPRGSATPPSRGMPRTTPPSHPVRPGPPPLPPADEKSTLRYEAGGNSVDVEGVCRITEEDVACWDARGGPHKDLAQRVREGLTQNEGYGNSFSVQFGKKNRVVVARVTRLRRNGPQPYMSVMHVGEGYGTGGGSIQLPQSPEAMRYEEGKPQVNYEARTFAVDRGQKTTRMRLQVSEPINEFPTLDLRKGATAAVGGMKIEVVGISRVSADNPRYGGYRTGGQPGWLVRLRQSGKRSVSFNLSPLDASGRPIAYADASGKPVSFEEAQARMQRHFQEASKSGRPAMGQPKGVQPVQMMMVGTGRPGEMEMILSVDPKFVPKTRVSAQHVKTVDVDGIPVDPR